MSSVKTRKLDISTILSVVRAQTGSGATGPTNATNSVVTNDNTDLECFIPFVNSTPDGTAQPLKGNSSLIYRPLTTQLEVPRIKPVTIRDSTESSGSAGQVLSSTGSALSWIGPLGYAIIRSVRPYSFGSGVCLT